MGHFDGMVITRDLWCIGCGYNLRTMEIAGRCPECGELVERSLLVLPDPALTSGAIKLAAWSFVVSLGSSFAAPIGGVSSLMFLAAIHRLYHRCAFAHTSVLDVRLRWLWRTACVATIGSLYLLVQELATGSSGGWLATACLPQTVPPPAARIAQSLPAPRPGEGPLRMAVSNTSATVEFSNDGQGGIAVVSGIIEVASLIAALAAGVLYLLVCRLLAARAQQPRLATNFRTILGLGVGGILGLAAAVALIAASGFPAAAPAAAPVLPRLTPVLVVGALLIIPSVGLLLVSTIWDIVASFQLAGALARAPSALSQIAATPE